MTIQEFESASYTDNGSFEQILYERADRKRDTHVILLSADGTVRSDGASCSIGIEKKFRFKRNTVQAEYVLDVRDGETLTGLFAPELNFAFLSEDPESLALTAQSSSGKESTLSSGRQVCKSTCELRMEDLVNKTVLTVSTSEPVELWVLPVRTVSNCEDGLETSYQGTTVVPRFPLSVAAGDTRSVTVSIRIERRVTNRGA